MSADDRPSALCMRRIDIRHGNVSHVHTVLVGSSARLTSLSRFGAGHNATLAMQNAFTPNVTVFVNWNNWAGRFYTPGGSEKSPSAGTGGHDW